MTCPDRSRLISRIARMDFQREVPHRDASLNEPQHQLRAPHLQQGGRLAHVRVPDDDVQASVALRIRVRLVAGVDDRPATVVADDTLSQMCSARWLTLYSALGCVQHLASAAISWRETRNGTSTSVIFEKSLILEIR